jgi:hypothetical protein
LCVRLIGASCQPWSAASPCVATGQAEIAAAGGAGRRPAPRRGRADASIARRAPLGVAAPLPRRGSMHPQALPESGTTEELKATVRGEGLPSEQAVHTPPAPPSR